MVVPVGPKTVQEDFPRLVDLSRIFEDLQVGEVKLIPRFWLVIAPLPARKIRFLPIFMMNDDIVFIGHHQSVIKIENTQFLISNNAICVHLITRVA